MRLKALTLIIFGVLFTTITSCTSEYEECLEQGRCLKEKLVEAQGNYELLSSDNLVQEIYYLIIIDVDTFINEELSHFPLVSKMIFTCK